MLAGQALEAGMPAWGWSDSSRHSAAISWVPSALGQISFWMLMWNACFLSNDLKIVRDVALAHQRFMRTFCSLASALFFNSNKIFVSRLRVGLVDWSWFAELNIERFDKMIDVAFFFGFFECNSELSQALFWFGVIKAMDLSSFSTGYFWWRLWCWNGNYRSRDNACLPRPEASRLITGWNGDWVHRWRGGDHSRSREDDLLLSCSEALQYLAVTTEFFSFWA